MRYADASDEELLAMSGERPEAFGVFYGRFEGEVLAFLVRATRRADLVAEVFAAAMVAAARL